MKIPAALINLDFIAPSPAEIIIERYLPAVLILFAVLIVIVIIMLIIIFTIRKRKNRKKWQHWLKKEMKTILPEMLFALLLTVMIETAAALVLKVKTKKDILNIVIINCITNPILNIALAAASALTSNKTPLFILFLIFEALAVISEYCFYKKRMEYNYINLLLFSFILNGFSFFTGILLRIFCN